MIRYMLDTNICSYAMKRSSAALVRRLRSVPVEQVCMSVVTKAELLHGARISPRSAQDAEALEAFLTYVQALDLAEDAAEHYADIRADLSRGGEMIGANDLFIAAHARSLGITLVTNNRSHFGRVRGLDIENWAA